MLVVRMLSINVMRVETIGDGQRLKAHSAWSLISRYPRAFMAVLAISIERGINRKRLTTLLRKLYEQSLFVVECICTIDLRRKKKVVLRFR